MTPTDTSLLATLLSMPLTLLSLRGGTVYQESRARPLRRSATRLPALRQALRLCAPASRRVCLSRGAEAPACSLSSILLREGGLCALAHSKCLRAPRERRTS